MKSVGTNLKKINNMGMNPYQYLPKYGMGSWLKENAGTVGSLVGAGLGTIIAPGIGTSVGATLGGSIGGAVQGTYNNQLSAEQQAAQVATQQAMANAANMALPQYGASFKNGGKMKSAMYKQGGLLNSMACGGKLKAMGGKLESNNTPDNVSIYKNGGSHSENKLGGIPLSNRGLVEQGEVRHGNYIFTNRF